jgi:hypothetical protein
LIFENETIPEFKFKQNSGCVDRNLPENMEIISSVPKIFHYYFNRSQKNQSLLYTKTSFNLPVFLEAASRLAGI